MTLKFLIAYYMYSDSYNTLGGVGAFFAVSEMNVPASEIMYIAMLSPCSAISGLFFWRWFQKKTQKTAKQCVKLCCYVFMFIAAYGAFGYTGFIGVVYVWELYVVIFLYGSCLGSCQSYTRTCFAEIIPPGQEAEFFGIYEISDKGSSWLGPLVCGAVYQKYKSMRPGFIYLFFMAFAGVSLLDRVDVQEAADTCRRKEIQVRMEAIRSKLGVSKVQIQMNAKKFLGVASKVSTQSSNASSVRSRIGTMFSKRSRVSTASSASGVSLASQNSSTMMSSATSSAASSMASSAASVASTTSGLSSASSVASGFSSASSVASSASGIESSASGFEGESSASGFESTASGIESTIESTIEIDDEDSD